MDRLDTLFPGRVEPDSADYPGGAFRDKSTDTSNDGTPITLAQQINNIWGALLGILNKAGLSPDDNTETALVSQVANAIFNSASISNAAIKADLTLAKFSQGTMTFSNFLLSASGILFGTDGVTRSHLTKKGILLDGSATPGGGLIAPYMRWSVYDIRTSIAAASTSDAITGLGQNPASGHYHAIGTLYDFASPYVTNIPTSTNVFFSTISFTNTAGDRRCGVPVDTQLLENATSGKLELNRVYKYGYISSTIDDTYPVYLTVFYDASFL